MIQKRLLTGLIVLMVRAGVAAGMDSGIVGKPTNIWTRTEPLGEVPVRLNDNYPLSDQTNAGGWCRFEAMSDEFEEPDLDLGKWNRGLYWWKGRQPALFSDANVTVSDGKLHLAMRREKLAPEAEADGYKDYSSAAIHSKVRSGYGYYEVKARPMNSAGSSAFWFQVEEIPGWLTEIDVLSSAPRPKATSTRST